LELGGLVEQIVDVGTKRLACVEVKLGGAFLWVATPTDAVAFRSREHASLETLSGEDSVSDC